MYRSVKGKVHAKGSAVIEDRGYLKRAATDSKGDYLFSERGAGVQELVLLGSRTDLMVWLGMNYKRSIHNIIPSLPEIYMAVEPYKPGARFKGLFPVGDVIKSLTDATVGMFTPSSSAAIGGGINIGHIQDVSGCASDLKGALIFKPEVGSKSRAPKSNGELYVKFSYLPGDNMTKVGQQKVDFQSIRKLIQAATA